MIDEKILDTYFSRGLRAGLGSTDDRVCLEAAIALASGEPLTDRPSCVSPVDRAFWLVINDGQWSSPEARADALRPAVLPQLGTAERDRVIWAQTVVLGMIREILPLALRAVVGAVPDHAAALLAVAERCTAAPDLTETLETLEAAQRMVESAAEATKWTAESAAMRAARAGARAVERTAKAAMRTTEAGWMAENAAAWAAEAAARETAATDAAKTTTVARAADAALPAAARATAQTATNVASETTYDNVLRAAVQVGLRAYEQTS